MATTSMPVEHSEPSEVSEVDGADQTGVPAVADGTVDTDGTKDAVDDRGAQHGTGDDAGDGPSAKTVSGVRLLTVVPGVPRYHEPNCILIRFMPANDVRNLTVPEAKKLGTPCVACQPED